MRITDLEIEGFGVWSGLKIEKFSGALNVLYGPNEAGKTTLLQFIRSMLYGFSASRQKYLPPIHGGRPGGRLDLSSPHGRFAVGRYRETSAEGTAGEQVTLTAPDGTRQGEHFIKVLLSSVDEPVFNNVFAVGLREIQELATLSDTEAAEMLYSLSAGLDRVSLVEVIRELENSRNRLLDAAGGPCQVVQLLQQRDALCEEIDQLGSINRRWGQLAVQREQLHQEIARWEEDAHREENALRVVDLALALRDRWARRAALDDQLSALGAPGAMPAGAVQRLDAIGARIARRQEQLDRLARSRDDAKREFAALAVNEAVGRQAARIEALGEQESWIVQLQQQIEPLRGEIGAMESELAAQRGQLGLKPDQDWLPDRSTRSLASLRSPAKRLRQCHARWEESKQAADVAQQSAESLHARIHEELSARGQTDLAEALDRSGALVAQYRRRAQLDEQLDQLDRYQEELHQRSRMLVDRQLLPVGVLIGLGAVFVVGVVLVLTGLFMPESIVRSFGWALALLGLAGSGAAAVAKVMFERSNVHQLDACRKQLDMLQLQRQQAVQDRDALDARLPAGAGPLAGRLQTAERDLASLEELSPLEARRSAAEQQVASARRRARETQEELRQSRRRWREALASVGLPEDLHPKHVRRMLQRGGRIGEIQSRLTQRREELAHRQREWESLTARIAQLASETGVSLGSANPIEQLRELGAAVAVQQAAVARRDALRIEARRIRLQRARHEEAIAGLKHRRRQLFFGAGVKDEQEFRQRALEHARADVLRRERDALDREIHAALDAECSEEAIRRQLEAARSVPLETRREQLHRRLTTLREQLHQRLETRGRLDEQWATLASDRQLAVKRLELAIVDKRLQDAVARWRVLAVTCRILDVIRTTYERHRQPETLQEASGYLDRLTQGRYRRVWTPLGEPALRVDDAEGNPLPVEVLSRGTREQLFLSLRLALASSYARRGAPLPLVLDDVLVNFDADRAKAAAGVLRDFAAAGHQLLVFTCHEHILKLFQSLKVPVSRLPDNAEPGRALITLERQSDASPAPKRPQRKAAAKTKPKSASKPVEPEPIEEEEEDFEEPKPRTSRSRGRTASGGSFDADFFDPDDQSDEKAIEDESEDYEEEEEEDEDDESLWESEDDEEEIEDLDDNSAAA